MLWQWGPQTLHLNLECYLMAQEEIQPVRMVHVSCSLHLATWIHLLLTKKHVAAAALSDLDPVYPLNNCIKKKKAFATS